jgi:F-type H+-transporting ATPase subunit c
MKKIMQQVGLLLVAAPAFAEEMAAATMNQAGGITDKAFVVIAMALVVGISALGGTLGQSRIGANAMDGIARNPLAAKPMFVPMILGLVFVESLVILAVVIAFILGGKI